MVSKGERHVSKGERHVIEVEGLLDRAAFGRLQVALRGLPPGERVLVDLSKVRELDDFMVAALAESAATGPARVEFSGLRQHHHRLMRYFGVAPAAL